MAETREEADEPFEPTEPALETNAIGVAAALDEARGDPSLRDEVAAFLKDQRALIVDQRHHLHEQFKQLDVQLKQLKIRSLGERLKVMLQLFAVISALLVGISVVSLVWQAHNAKGLVIEPLSVPPDMVQRGLTGEVAATKLLDQPPNCRRRRTASAPSPASHAAGATTSRSKSPRPACPLPSSAVSSAPGWATKPASPERSCAPARGFR